MHKVIFRGRLPLGLHSACMAGIKYQKESTEGAMYLFGYFNFKAFMFSVCVASEEKKRNKVL